MVIGGSLPPTPTAPPRWDTSHIHDCPRIPRGSVHERDTPVSLHQRPQARPSPLRDLAVLLEGPPEPATEFRPVHSKRQLTGQHQPLIGTQPRRNLEHPRQLQPARHERVDLGAQVSHLDLRPPAISQRPRLLQRRLQRAATPQGPPTIPHPRLEAQLQRVCQMAPPGEPLAVPHPRQQLQRRLAVAIFKVLPAQPPTVSTQQHLPLGPRHQRHLLGWVPRPLLPQSPGPRLRWTPRPRLSRTSRPRLSLTLQPRLRRDLRPQLGGAPQPRLGRSGPARSQLCLQACGRGWSFLCVSGRHAWMSYARTPRPPSQFLSCRAPLIPPTPSPTPRGGVQPSRPQAPSRPSSKPKPLP
jgi:hypothetical protein